MTRWGDAIHDAWKAREASRAASQVEKRPPPLVCLCRAAGLPAPVAEYRFHPARKWRFDYAWPDHKLAVEIDGGVWAQGRHTRGAGFIADQQKTNAAALLGFFVLRYTPDRLNECIDDLRVMFAGRA
jgi:very-short-patch-repair endonuclease